MVNEPSHRVSLFVSEVKRTFQEFIDISELQGLRHVHRTSGKNHLENQ